MRNAIARNDTLWMWQVLHLFYKCILYAVRPSNASNEYKGDLHTHNYVDWHSLSSWLALRGSKHSKVTALSSEEAKKWWGIMIGGR